MADKREEAVALSDDDLDELVAEAEDDDSTDAPEHAVADTSTDDQPAELQASDNAADAAGPDDDDDEQPEEDADDALPAPAAATPGKPFQFKASGADRVLPGVYELPDGSAVVPKDAVADFRRTLASAAELQANFRQFQRDSQRERQQLQAQRTAKDATADAVFDLFKDLTTKDEDELWQWVLDFKNNAPQLELDIQRKQLEAEREALKAERRGPQPTPEEISEVRQAAIESGFNETFRQLAAHDEVKKHLTTADLTTIYSRWANRKNRLVAIATEDDPASGIQKGQEYFDATDLIDAVELAIEVKKQASGARSAAAVNNRMNADMSNRIPPAARPARSAAATQPRGKKAAAFDRNAFMRGELDDDLD